MNLRQMAAEAATAENESIAARKTRNRNQDFNWIKNLLAKMGVDRDNCYTYAIIDGQAVLRLDGLAFRVGKQRGYNDYLQMHVQDWPDDAQWESVYTLVDIGGIIERGPVIPKPAQDCVPVEQRIADALEGIRAILVQTMCGSDDRTDHH